jgi:hypothetical protein
MLSHPPCHYALAIALVHHAFPALQDVVTIRCQGSGRYLSIQRLTAAFEGSGDRTLAMAEVQVRSLFA